MTDMYYEGITEIAKETDVAKVNKMLSAGWKLLAIRDEGEQVSSEKGVALRFFVVFILGKGQNNTKPEPWKKNQDGTEWARASELPELAEKLKEKGGSFTENGYVYWLSKDGKSLHRKQL